MDQKGQGGEGNKSRFVSLGMWRVPPKRHTCIQVVTMQVDV